MELGPKERDEEGALLYLGYIGMCAPKGYGFSAVLVINRVLTFASLVFVLQS